MANLGSFTTFDSSGKLGQLENALAAVGNGKPSLGIRTKEGCVIITDRLLPNQRIIASSATKVEKICKSIGMTYAGIKPDFRQVVRFCRKKAGAYKLKYGEDIPVKQLAELVGEEMQRATQRGGMRPYGVSVLISGFDHRGAQLWMVDPSGTYFSWKGMAIGKKASNQKTFIEKRYEEDMDFEDAIHTGLITMREGFEGEMKPDTIEIGVATKDGFKILDEDEIKEYMDSLN